MPVLELFVADGKFVIAKQPTLVQFRVKPVQVEDNAATAAEIDTDAENLVAEMTAAAELGEQLNADAESSVVEIGSAELGESSSSNTDTISLSSSIAQLFDVKPHEVTDEGLANLKKFPFVTRSVSNILKRVGTNGSKKQHDPVIKATVGKLKLRYGLAVAKEVSELIGGPKKSTLKDMSKCKVPVLDYFYDKNIKAHLLNAKGLPIQIPFPFSFSPLLFLFVSPYFSFTAVYSSYSIQCWSLKKRYPGSVCFD